MATGRGRLLQQHWRGLLAQHLPRGGLGAARGSAGQGAGPRKEPGTTLGAGRAPRARGQSPFRNAGSSSVSLDSMPAEILLKILSYLDAVALLCAGCVNRRFYRLASDKASWKVSPVEKTAASVSSLSLEDKEAGYWKKEYIARQVASVRAALSRVLQPVSPYTGLPRRTKQVLRMSGLGWVLVLREKSGRERVLEHVHLSVNDASVTITWYGKNWPRLATLSTVDLCGVTPVFMDRAKPPPKNGPRWHSLITAYDLSRLTDATALGCDKLVRVFCLHPGLLVGLWKKEEELAFVTANLHVHHLVERSTLGSATVPHQPLPRQPLLDDGPEGGLHGYQLHLDMHSGDVFYLCGTFRDLFTKKVLYTERGPATYQRADIRRFPLESLHFLAVTPSGHIENGYVKLVVISFKDNTEHLPLIGKVGLSWKTNAFDGCVKSCCVMDVTLLDECARPFWCASSPVRMRPSPSPPDGPHLLGPTCRVDYADEDGRVCAELVWIEETEEHFLVSLVLHLSLAKVNRWFGTRH